MTFAIADITDSNLQVWRGDSRWHSPGYALLDGQQYTFGMAARAAARRRPMDINTRYWWELNTQPLKPALGPARHTADLVHAHLLALHKQAEQPDEVLFAVSSSMHKDQLALLLGIVEQCPFEAVGLVNRSVALACQYGGFEKLHHLEIQLHQAVISQLSESGGRVELQQVIPVPGCGMLQLQERLVEIIAAAFISQTRFDPRRKADTEQGLYDALPDTLRALANATETNVEVAGYRARIDRQDLESAARDLGQSTLKALGTLNARDRLILDPVAALLPGLLDQLPQPEKVESSALCNSVYQQQQHLLQRQETLHFITSLPILAHGIPPATQREEPISPAGDPVPVTPTHLLVEACAHPLVAEGTPIGSDWELHCDAGSWQLRGGRDRPIEVNGHPYRPDQPLQGGDRLTLDGGLLGQLIEVKQ
ncbi:MAG: hypothetical protein HOC23_06120 [Halieaceae bacterium]|jgi:hypothetical protein|nr:hypothetical protein [Halieaceae bacterium]